jgi:N-acetylneuraminic acid mutarotase
VRYLICVAALLLASCAGGGSGGGSAGPPSGLRYPTPPTFTVGQAITPLTPTVTGSVSSYSVSPALPAGLSLSASTGVISGQPSAVAATASYTVMASNAAGSTTAHVSITVAAAPASAPVITLQPASQSVPVYRPATFTVGATGNATLSYQWYYVAPVLMPSGAAIPGATSSTLTVSNSVTAAAAGGYYCVVTDTSNGSVKTTQSNTATLTVLTQRTQITLSGESAVLPGSAGHVVSTPAQAGLTYAWTISNGTITAGQTSNQATYTAGSLGHTVLTLTVLTPNGAGVAIQNVAVVSALPVVRVFAQPNVLVGSTGVLAASPPGQTYAWTVTNGTASATITSGQTSQILTYSVGNSAGTYTAGLTLTDALGNQGSDSETLNVIENAFVADAYDPGPRSLHTATLLNDGRVLIAGGDAGVPSATIAAWGIAGPNSNILATAELYDPATNTFAPVGSMSTSRLDHTATLLNDGRVLVVGGSNSTSTALASTEIYDPQARAWSAGPALAAARMLHSATLLSDGRVLVAGGVNASGSVLAAAEIYDPVTDLWSAAGTMTVARASHAATLLPNGQVLVAGGNNFGSPATFYNSAELYDPVANTWTATAAMPGLGSNAAVLLTTGQVLNAGAAALYDPPSGTWLLAQPFQDYSGGSPDWSGAVLLSDGRVLAWGSGGINAGIYDPISGAGLGTTLQSAPWQSGILLASGKVLGVGGVLYTSLAIGQLYDPSSDTTTLLSSGGHDGQLASAAVLQNGSVLVTGGNTEAGSSFPVTTAATDLYNPTTGLWSPTAAMATSRDSHTATLLGDGTVLAVGGRNLDCANCGPIPVLSSAERYNTSSNAWASGGSMANPRYQHTASLLGNGTVLVAGGSNAIIDSCSCTTFLSAAELYDPTSNTWSSTGSLATGRYGHTATVLSNGKVLVAGGYGGVPNTLKNVVAVQPTAELYDPASGLWSTTAPMNNARAYHTATLLPSGLVLVTGGTNGTATLAAAEVYDPTANTWTSVVSLNTPRQSHMAVLLPTGDVLVVGGYNSSSSAVFGVGTAELYDPTANTFTSAGAMLTLRQGFTLSLLSSGRVLLVGGLINNAGTPEFYQ